MRFRRGIGRRQHLVQRTFDAAEVVGDPAFEIGATHGLAAGLAERREVELGLIVSRKRHLRRRYGLIERIALVVFDEIDEGLQLFRLEAAAHQLFSDRHIRARS